MPNSAAALGLLVAIPDLEVRREEPVAHHTRFAICGPAEIFATAASVEAFRAALRVARAAGVGITIIGGGTNLIVSDQGVRGLVLRLAAGRMAAEDDRVQVEAGAVLDQLVDFTIDRGLKGIETLAGIPGWTGAAIYGNAGAYGHSISERVARVQFLDGEELRTLTPVECGFGYRESVFKRRKDWIIVSAVLRLERAGAAVLRLAAAEIRTVRDEKFPPSMRCAGSIFKNLLVAGLSERARSEAPPHIVREGKVPAAWFLEQAGAKGMARGGIRVADYHANLVYNAGGGTARELRELIATLKARVAVRFDLELEEEVQYVGF